MLFRNDKRDNRDATSNIVPLFPLRELIVFPHEVYPIFVGRQKSIKALEAAEAKKTPILLVTQKDPKVAEPAPGDLYAVGTLGVVDDDTVALSNLQRQVIHGTPEVGEPKVTSAARKQ